MSLEKKRQFIEATYKILKDEGPEGVKIRRLAEEMNCTSTVIYRHFDNLDHLIALASVEFLKKYIVDFRKMSTDKMITEDPYSLNLKMWECLAEYTFNNMDIFEPLFFGKYKENLGEIIFEYYQIFFENEKQDFDGYSVSILFNNDMIQRNQVLLRRAAGMGIIRTEHADIIASAEVYIFHGILRKYMYDSRNPATIRKAREEFLMLINTLSAQFRI